MCVSLGMLFVLVIFLKCATCSVVGEIWACRGVRLLRREGGGGGGGGGCCLRADHGMGSADTWRSAQHPGRPPDYIKRRIGGFVLHKLYHRCRPYDFC